MPEYTFAVENVGLRARKALGAHVARLPIGTGGTQLKTLLIEHAGVVVWVNSAYLVDYAPVYGSDPGYMHAVPGSVRKVMSQTPDGASQ
ncbi:hypothetical protein [Pseudomonas sp. P9_31]|uniref:hypothetical protein n=1 Tax=Pseudomonas sp. P9_31 TaxID=3043448 RepID=UPI002A3680E8|nr:hypothetical protein [Pseudomonas sp. P9_31]WPN60846.1 hypothetical protein QMK51_12460 [Pseudomonas sp. P9_31]